MSQQIFVNLAVKDLPRSIAFWKSIGYSFNPRFSDDTAACLIFSETNFAMLLTHEKFKSFAPREICDTQKQNEVMIALSCESKAAVAEKMQRALGAGAKRHGEAKDYGFMVYESFFDLDGHIWELMYMDPSQEK